MTFFLKNVTRHMKGRGQVVKGHMMNSRVVPVGPDHEMNIPVPSVNSPTKENLTLTVNRASKKDHGDHVRITRNRFSTADHMNHITDVTTTRIVLTKVNVVIGACCWARGPC